MPSENKPKRVQKGSRHLKTYKCPYPDCGKQMRKASLMKHIAGTHLNIKPRKIECRWCNKLLTPRGIRWHLEKQHDVCENIRKNAVFPAEPYSKEDLETI